MTTALPYWLRTYWRPWAKVAARYAARCRFCRWTVGTGMSAAAAIYAATVATDPHYCEPRRIADARRRRD